MQPEGVSLLVWNVLAAVGGCRSLANLLLYMVARDERVGVGEAVVLAASWASFALNSITWTAITLARHCRERCLLGVNSAADCNL